jgi:hypothetical protein
MMKIIPIMLVLAVPVAAHAQPGLVEPAPAQDAYVVAGLTSGADEGGLYVGPRLDLGRQLFGPLWTHGFATGAVENQFLFVTGTGTRVEAGAGLELRGCMTRLCAEAGVDLAYRSLDNTLDGTVPNSTTMTTIAGRDEILHAGIDAGRGHLRARTSLDFGVAGGLSLTQGIGYMW